MLSRQFLLPLGFYSLFCLIIFVQRMPRVTDSVDPSRQVNSADQTYSVQGENDKVTDTPAAIQMNNEELQHNQEEDAMSEGVDTPNIQSRFEEDGTESQVQEEQNPAEQLTTTSNPTPSIQNQITKPEQEQSNRPPAEQSGF